MFAEIARVSLAKHWRGVVRGGAWALSIYALILIVRVFA